jgi:hypothetical protein
MNGSHIPVLTFLIPHVSSVLELGAGNHSTPFLKDCNIELLTIETDKHYVKKYIGKCKAQHAIITGLPSIEITKLTGSFGIVFVDHNPASDRRVCIEMMLGKCRFIVAHDSQPSENANYHYQEIELPEGYVRFDYKVAGPHTMIILREDDELFERVKEFCGEA